MQGSLLALLKRIVRIHDSMGTEGMTPNYAGKIVDTFKKDCT